MLTSHSALEWFIVSGYVIALIETYFDPTTFADCPQQLPWLAVQIQTDVTHYYILDSTQLVPGCKLKYTLPRSIDIPQGIKLLETDLYENGKFRYVNGLESPLKEVMEVFSFSW